MATRALAILGGENSKLTPFASGRVAAVRRACTGGGRAKLDGILPRMLGARRAANLHGFTDL